MGKQVFVEESAGNSTHNDMLGLASATLERQNPTGTCNTSRWARTGLLLTGTPEDVLYPNATDHRT